MECFAAYAVVVPDKSVYESCIDEYSKFHEILDKYELPLSVYASSITYSTESAEEYLYDYFQHSIDDDVACDRAVDNTIERINESYKILTKGFYDRTGCEIEIISSDYSEQTEHGPQKPYWATKIELSDKIKNINGELQIWTEYE